MSRHGEDPAEGLVELVQAPQISSPVPAHPLDPTFSPSREGSTPMPGIFQSVPPTSTGDHLAAHNTSLVARGSGPYGMNAVAAADPLHTRSGPGPGPGPGAASGPGPNQTQNQSRDVAAELAFASAATVAPSSTPYPAMRVPTGKTPPPSIAASRPGSSSSNTPSLGALPALFVGHVLGGRWEVQQRIGIGGMASVHAGVDHRLGRPVAIKILHPHVAENPDSRTRLGREARAIAQLKHENIIEVYDYSSDDPECTWLVTELIDGASLRQVLDRVEKPMPEVAVMIVTEVVRALRAAHAMGIVHRDVKPDNILVGSSGRPKLSDFGIAQIVNEERMTLTGNLVGSPSYMSPEQANGKRTDHRTDLFSAGILLYRLVTGTLPFRGATAIETIRLVSTGVYTDPVDIEAGSAGAVAGIIRRALATNIDERYQTADEMLHDLAIVLQDAGLSATWEELPKFFKDPSGYQAALKPRLARELEARGKSLLEAGEETRAVDCFNRALSLGEGNQRTLDLVRELSKRRGKGRIQRFVWATSVALGAIAMITTVLLLTDRLLPSNAATPESEARAPAVLPIDSVAPKQQPPEPPPARQQPEPVEAAAVAPAAEPELVAPPKRTRAERRGSRSVEKSEHKAEPKVEPKVESRSTIIAAGMPQEDPPKVDTPVEKADPHGRSDPKLYGTLQIGTSVWADIYIDGKKVGTAPERSRYPLAPGPHRLKATKPNCLPDEKEFSIAAGETTRLRLTIKCD